MTTSGTPWRSEPSVEPNPPWQTITGGVTRDSVVRDPFLDVDVGWDRVERQRLGDAADRDEDAGPKRRQRVDRRAVERWEEW